MAQPARGPFPGAPAQCWGTGQAVPAQTKGPSPQLLSRQARWPRGRQAAPSPAGTREPGGHVGPRGEGRSCTGPPHPGPEGGGGSRAQDALQAGVADPAGPGLLPQLLRSVECVLPLRTASTQGLNQVHGRARPEEAPAEGSRGLRVSAPSLPAAQGGTEALRVGSLGREPVTCKSPDTQVPKGVPESGPFLLGFSSLLRKVRGVLGP